MHRLPLLFSKYTQDIQLCNEFKTHLTRFLYFINLTGNVADLLCSKQHCGSVDDIVYSVQFPAQAACSGCLLPPVHCGGLLPSVTMNKMNNNNNNNLFCA